MLSTISSFLPSALSDKLDKLDLHSEQSHTEQTDDEEGIKRRDMALEGQEGVKKEKKKRSTSNETFIVVRPPPAKNNHPLNLQLQLVPAQHPRERSNTSATTTPTNSRFSADYTQANEGTPAAAQPPSPSASSEADHGLQRTVSTRSNRSEASTFYANPSSAGSVTSFASTASNASGRRMIIPLYNLCAHNVMTNTIVDAGTDAKVAKFLKRGIELIGLAVLEPTEVWNGPTIDLHRSVSGNSLLPPGQSGSRAATPDTSQHSPGSSRLSLSSDHSSHVQHPADPAAPLAPAAATPQQTGAKKIFGRIFRKKESSGGGGHTPTSSVSGLSAVNVEPPTPNPELRTPTMQAAPAPPRPEILLAPVLGLTPTAANPPTGRCVAHVWTVRRWLKTDSQGLISGVIGKISREVSSHGYGSSPELLEWEVRFEWARGRPKGERTRKRKTSLEANGGKNSRTPSRRSSALLEVENPREGSPRHSLDVVPERPAARASSPRRPPVTGAPKGTSVSSTAPSDEEAGEDPGDESDPEDSETPWTCTLVLTHPSHPIAQLAPRLNSKSHSRTRSVSSSVGVAAPGPGPTPSDTPLRLKVATLAPAPHHPKVVCQLKVPFPLPDVEVEHGVLCKRLVLPDGSTRSTVPRERAGLVMTAEEIKDVVCSTAFWVVVRQGFGGLGKKNRKGDGWKIRG